jgi:hypothetical protein
VRVSDKVWATVVPSVGALRPRTRIAVGALILTIVAGLYVSWYQPKVVADGWGVAFVDPSGKIFQNVVMPVPPSDIVQILFGARNDGPAGVQLVAIRAEGPGVEFVRAVEGSIHSTPTGYASGAGPFLQPRQLSGDAGEQFGVELRISDCHRADEMTITLTLASWRGHQDVTLPMTWRRVHLPGGGFSTTTDNDPRSVSLVRWAADLMCGTA